VAEVRSQLQEIVKLAPSVRSLLLFHMQPPITPAGRAQDLVVFSGPEEDFPCKMSYVM
jgi:hypothetical protein